MAMTTLKVMVTLTMLLSDDFDDCHDFMMIMMMMMMMTTRTAETMTMMVMTMTMMMN